MKYGDKQVEVRRMVEQDKAFVGKAIDQMPLLLGEGRSPWATARFMRERMDNSEQFPDLLNHLYVSDLIAYDSDKKSTDVKFILTVDKYGAVTEEGRKVLELINPNAKLTSDHAANVNGVYDFLPGIVVPRADLGILEKDLTQGEILNSRVWRISARHPDEVPAEFAEDPDLLKEYAGWVRGKTKQDKNMGVSFGNNSEDAKLRAWCVYRLEYGSDADGGGGLGGRGGRLVGYLAPNLKKKITET